MPPLDDDLWTLALEHARATAPPTNALRDLLWRSLHLSGWKPQPLHAHGPPSTTDRGLLERFVHGDAEAFEALVDRHGGPMLAFARRSLPNEYARDAAQEAFLALFSRAHEVIAAPERSVQGFLFQATRVETTKLLREQLLDEGPVDALVAALPSGEPAALEPLLARERPQVVLAALARACTALEQELVLLHLQGKTHPEIAATLELEPDHVRVLEHRASTTLARALAEPT